MVRPSACHTLSLMTMTSLPLRLLAVLFLALSQLGVTSSADALADQRWSRADRVGEVAATADIRRVTATWNAKTHTTRVSVRDLGNKGELRVALGHEGEIYHAVVVKKARLVKSVVQLRRSFRIVVVRWDARHVERQSKHYRRPYPAERVHWRRKFECHSWCTLSCKWYQGPSGSGSVRQRVEGSFTARPPRKVAYRA
jgi:hypothetical protein